MCGEITRIKDGVCVGGLQGGRVDVCGGLQGGRVDVWGRGVTRREACVEDNKWVARRKVYDDCLNYVCIHLD